MFNRSRFETLLTLTNNMALLWQNAHGIASQDTANKMDNAMLTWQYELTKCLEIWITKGLKMTYGELILARANLGAVVEFWLKFFFTVYYDDYVKNPKKNRQGMIEPEAMRFEDLKQFSSGILWDDNRSPDYCWVESVQQKRNAIHSFTHRDVGTPQLFLDDVEYLYGFVEMLINQLPPIEDVYTCLPEGYIHDAYFD